MWRSTRMKAMHAAQILADTGGRGVDCAIDCAAKEHTHNWAFRVARNGGRMVLTGIHSAAVVRLRSVAHAPEGDWRFSTCGGRITSRTMRSDS